MIARYLFWNLRNRWKQLRSEPAVLAIILIGLPVLIFIYGGMGARIGSYLATAFETDDPEQFATAIRRWLAAYCLILIFVSPPQTVQSHLVEKQLRELRALQQLPFRDFQLYCIRMLKEVSAIYLFLLPLTLIPTLQMAAAAVPTSINLLLFLSPFLFLFWIMVCARLVMTVALLASPQNILGWRVAFGAIIILVASIAGPLGDWLVESDFLASTTLLPLSDWVGTAAIAILEGNSTPVLIRIAAAIAFTLALFATDVLVFRYLLLRRSDFLLARAMQSSRVHRFEQALLHSLHRLPQTIGSIPFGPLLRRDLTWMLRDPVLGFAFLIPLLTMALAFGFVELMLPVQWTLFHPSFALAGTMLVAATLLLLGGIILPAISLPALGRSLAHFLETPWKTADLLTGEILSTTIPTTLMWWGAWGLLILFAPGSGIHLSFLAHTAVPFLILLTALFCCACGVPLGCISRKTNPRNPFLSIHIAGIASQLSLGMLAVLSIPGSIILPFTLGPTFWPFPIAVLCMWTAWTRFLFVQGNQTLRTVLRPN